MTQSAEQTPDVILDLRGTPCPLNFIKAKLRLEQMPVGNLLELVLDAGEPIEQVPNSLKLEGYRIEALHSNNGFFTIHVRRPVEP
jgi:TusA-related sulfurtransferase